MSKNLVVKSTMFPHREIHKHTWTSPYRKMQIQIDHILIDRKWQSSILDVCSFRGADCDTDHCLVVAKVRERLAVSKQAAQKLDGERFNLRELKDLEVKKQYQIEITNRFANLGNISDDGEINRAWVNIKENIKTSTKKSLSCMNWSSINPGLMKNAYIFWIKGSRQNCNEYRIQVKGM